MLFNLRADAHQQRPQQDGFVLGLVLRKTLHPLIRLCVLGLICEGAELHDELVPVTSIEFLAQKFQGRLLLGRTGVGPGTKGIVSRTVFSAGNFSGQLNCKIEIVIGLEKTW